MELAIDHAESADRIGKWGVFGAVSLIFFFLNLSTFTSLGVVLYTMVAELHWSLTAAGFSFTVLGLACGLSSPLAAVSMNFIGNRATICLGAFLLLAGFALASLSHSMGVFYAAMVLLGIGYSLGGNVPAVALIAGWFKRGSSRIIGFYLMLGALGAAFGPPIVQAIVADVGWRGHWRVMAYVAGAIGIVCYLLVRETGTGTAALAERALAAGVADRGLDAQVVTASVPWTPREAVFTSQFLLVSAAMAATMACVTTINSIIVPHLAKMGVSPAAAAFVLSAIAVTATFVKGAAGRVCELVTPTTILSAGQLMQAAGCVMLAYASNPVLQYASAFTFGTGWGLAYVSGTVVLLDYFGPDTGPQILSIVWLLTTVAAAGATGRRHDRGPLWHLRADLQHLRRHAPGAGVADPAHAPAASPAGRVARCRMNGPTPVDLLITDTIVVTMDAQRRIIMEGAIAVRGNIIVAVGKSADLRRNTQPREIVDGRRFVITPGTVNTHVHVTGEPLTRGVVPDDSGWADNVFGWLVPIHMAYTEADERLSSQMAALEMLRSGTTCFLEAGDHTISRPRGGGFA